MRESELRKEDEKRAIELSRKFVEEARRRGITEEQLLQDLQENRVVEHSAEEKVDLGESVLQSVISLYREIPEVEAIYQRQSADRIKIWVFTSNTQHDKELAKQLASRESSLLEKFDDVDILLRHIPSVLCSDHTYVTGANAALIYKR